MKDKQPSVRRVVMAKRVATTWLSERAVPEYRLRVYHGYGRESRNLPGLLRSFRDGKVKIAGAELVSDLGVKPGFDYIDLWSKDRAALRDLEASLQLLGCETTGVW
jgi:hypothetical protein